MKNTLLLLFAGLATFTAGAQQPAAQQSFSQHSNHQSSAAEKTTSPGGSRWYFYGDALGAWEAHYNDGTASTFQQFISPWADTNSHISSAFAPLTYYVNMVSNGIILAPQDTMFNDYNLFGGRGKIKITNLDAYTVDSIYLLGIYGHNLASSSVDTIRLSLIYDTFSTGGIAGASILAVGITPITSPYSGINCPTLPYDSITNISQVSYVPPSLPFYTQDIILDNRAGGAIYSADGAVIDTYYYGPAFTDTTTSVSPLGGGLFGTFGGSYAGNNGGIAIKLNHVLNVPATGLVAVSVTYFSNLPAPPAPSSPGTGGALLATVSASGSTTYNYNTFQPLVEFASDGGSPPTALLVPFSAGIPAGIPNNPYIGTNQNNNTGVFKTLPNFENGYENIYRPNWAWFTPVEEASENQYPYYAFHVNCSSCDTVAYRLGHGAAVNNVVNSNNIVNVYPNPAGNELNIAFSLAQAAAVSVTLTNMVGEVMAVQKMDNMATGKAVFNTVNFADGIYIYTLMANGVNVSTGHIAIYN